MSNGSQAEAVGMKAGYRVLEVNGSPVNSLDSFNDAMSKAKLNTATRC